MLNLPATVNLEGDALDVYNRCWRLESSANTADQKMLARVLGYLVLYAPPPAGSHEMTKMIRSCPDENCLFELGNFFVTHFIFVFKKYKGRMAAPSSHSSRLSLDLDRDRNTIMQNLLEAPKDHCDAKEKALIRDGYRCVVTGKYDMLAETELDFIDETAILLYTECAHIVPDSKYFNTNDIEAHDSTSMLAVLKRFGYDIDELNGPKAHSLFNVVTMEKNARYFFDCLQLWFEATDTANRYHVATTNRRFRMPQEVTFTTDTKLPLPSPKLLALHAACAKVAHLSGAGDYIDKLDRDTEDLGVLSSDGQSSNILNHAPLRLSYPTDHVTSVIKSFV